MRKKHSYRSVDVQALEAAKLLELLPKELVIVGIDIAKHRQVVAFADPSGETQRLCHFEHPTQTPLFLRFLEGLVQAGRKLQIVLEPTGTYGDALRNQCHQRGWEVFMLSPNKTHDAKELYDGVPSQHDAKDATLIAKVHTQGLSRRFTPRSEADRTVRALVTQRELYAKSIERLQGQLEGLLACHFPELEQHLDVREQKSALKLLVAFPGPQQMAKDPEGVKEVLRRGSCGKLSPKTVKGVLGAAEQTQGVAPVLAEQDLLRTMASELLRLMELLEQLKPKLRALLEQLPEAMLLVATLGLCTTAVLWAYLGSLNSYGCVGALEKACGLNLKVSSSGRDRRKKRQPGLHITKRGPGIVRKYLYLATLRWLQRDPVAVAWYQARSGYTEASKMRAVVALMRKLVALLWHLSRGATYEPGRLFDLRRLCPKEALSGGCIQHHDSEQEVTPQAP